MASQESDTEIMMDNFLFIFFKTSWELKKSQGKHSVSSYWERNTEPKPAQRAPTYQILHAFLI